MNFGDCLEENWNSRISSMSRLIIVDADVAEYSIRRRSPAIISRKFSHTYDTKINPKSVVKNTLGAVFCRVTEHASGRRLCPGHSCRLVSG
jgi:hypothetical protein